MLFELSFPYSVWDNILGYFFKQSSMSFDFKRGQLESLMGQDHWILVEDCLRN